MSGVLSSATKMELAVTAPRHAATDYRLYEV